MPNQAVYLDCNSSNPILKDVAALVYENMLEFHANPQSEHSLGREALARINNDRKLIAELSGSPAAGVIFTSGATESNNLATIGLLKYGKKTNRRHIITSKIEHPSVLNPISYFEKHKFSVDYLNVDENGQVRLRELEDLLRPDSLLVSIMDVNNETGIKQPIAEIAAILADFPMTLFHSDMAQGFLRTGLRPPARIDLLSLSAHKLYGPVGIGALVMRPRNNVWPPIHARSYGSSAERGLRAGTPAQALIAGFARALSSAEQNMPSWQEQHIHYRNMLLKSLETLKPKINNKLELSCPHVLNLSFPSIDMNAESLILNNRDLFVASKASACASMEDAPSYVLRAMGLSAAEVEKSIRLSWWHESPQVDWPSFVQRMQQATS